MQQARLQSSPAAPMPADLRWRSPTLRRVPEPAVRLNIFPAAHVPSLLAPPERAVDRAYMARGGLARGDELLTLVRTRCDQPISRVARWIVAREVVHYRSGLDVAFPLFQFDPDDMSIRPAVRGAVAELSSELDDLELAQWFVRPNAALQGVLPADLLALDADAVIDAARADRYFARG